MYKILLDGKTFVSSSSDALRVINPVVTLEANKAGSMTMTVPKAHPFFDELQERKSLVEVYMGNETEPLFAGVLVSYVDDFFGNRAAVFEGELTFLNDSVQRPARYQGQTVRQLLEAYINAHNASVGTDKQFAIGQVTVDGGSSIYRFTNWQNTMQEINEDVIEDLGGFLRVRHPNGTRTLDCLADSPRTSTQVIRLGDNLIDFSSNLDTKDICTVLIPLGAKIEAEEGTEAVDGLEERLTIKSVNDNKDYLESTTAIAKYGRIEKVQKWDDVNNATILKTKGTNYLTSVQFADIYIEAKAVDLHYDDPSIERIRLLDTVRVVSAPHGLDRNFMLTKQTVHLDNPEQDTFTLGKNETPTLTASSASVSKQLEKIDDLPTTSFVTSAIANATALITGNDGGHVVIHYDAQGKPDEILVMDTEDINTAQKVWRWNQNGFGYSSTGYNGPYGTAITMNGQIVGSYIDTNSLVAKNGDFTESFRVDKVFESGIVNYISCDETEVSMGIYIPDDVTPAHDTGVTIYANARGTTEMTFKADAMDFYGIPHYLEPTGDGDYWAHPFATTTDVKPFSHEFTVTVQFDAGTIGTRGMLAEVGINKALSDYGYDPADWYPISHNITYVANSNAYNPLVFFSSNKSKAYVSAYRATASAVNSSIRFEVIWMRKNTVLN